MLEGAQMKVMPPTPWRGPGGQGCALRGIPGSGHRPSYSSSSSSYAISAEEASQSSQAQVCLSCRNI